MTEELWVSYANCAITVLFLTLMGLGIWKFYEIGAWFFHHLQIGWLA